MYMTFQCQKLSKQQSNASILSGPKKVSCCIAGCNFVNYAPILRNSTVRKLTKFPEKCILLVNC